jgi:hypothetical protein
MRVGIFGSKDWDNYSDIVRSLTVFIQEAHELGHDNITFVHTGSLGAENMITEYIGKTRRFLYEKNFKIREELIKNQTQVMKDVGAIESGLEFAIVFSTKCKRTLSCQRVLKEYQVPYRVVESA